MFEAGVLGQGIAALAISICREMGLDPNNVARLELTSRQATATVYRLNDDGKKYTVDGEPATETITLALEPPE